MSFNELNSVGHDIIQKLSGKHLSAADASSSAVMEDATLYGSFPWPYRSAEALHRPTDQVLLEGELREAVIRIHPEITANPALADEVIGQFLHPRAQPPDQAALNPRLRATRRLAEAALAPGKRGSK